MNKLKTRHYIVILTIAILISFIPVIIKADSGWDYDYDYDYDYSYNYDYDNDYDYDYDTTTYSTKHNYYASSGYHLTIFDFALILLIIVIIVCFHHQTRYQGIKVDKNYHEINHQKVKDVDSSIDVDLFKILVFDKYRELQRAIYNHDYQLIKQLTTKKMYDISCKKIDSLKQNRKKMLTYEIEYLDAKIINATNDNQIKKIEVYLKVAKYHNEYRKNKKTTLKVNKYRETTEVILTLVKLVEDYLTTKKCPNCGAPVESPSTLTCPYCDSTLLNINLNYVISEQIEVGQQTK